jgi:hypothetical protein
MLTLVSQPCDMFAGYADWAIVSPPNGDPQPRLSVAFGVQNALSTACALRPLAVEWRMNRISRKQRKAPLVTNTIARGTTDGETRTQEATGDSVAESRSLFHYTTAEGIIGILQNQCLFATHADFLSDSTECRAILAVLLPRLEAQLKEIVPKLIARRLIHPSVATDHGETIYRREAENMLQAMVQQYCTIFYHLVLYAQEGDGRS